jgi:magnesium-transporting ATPase (P-type)
LPTITLALAVGVRRMARRRALLKRLTAVETLGSTNVICTDKTGTLTEGRMVLSRFWSDGEELVPGRDDKVPGEPFAGLLRTAVRCSNASLRRTSDGFERTGDPSESALLAAAARLGEDVERAQKERQDRRRRLYHFDARVKRMTTADEEPDGSLWYHVKGAPLELLGRCAAKRAPDGADRALTDEDREKVRLAFEHYAGEGLRVLGFAERKVPGPELDEERDGAESHLTFLGLAALEDPPRPDVAEAVSRCRQAGIRIIVVTGDHGLTATAVARKVGIVTGEPRVVTGPELDAMAQEELDTLLRETPELIVARTNPET